MEAFDHDKDGKLTQADQPAGGGGGILGPSAQTSDPCCCVFSLFPGGVFFLFLFGAEGGGGGRRPVKFVNCQKQSVFFGNSQGSRGDFVSGLLKQYLVMMRRE